MADAAARGAKGLKVWKDLGLHLRDPDGGWSVPDDPRLDPVWDACAAAAIPVTIHTADPAAFFDPLDAWNERVEELLEHPDWWFGDRERFPAFERLLDKLEALIARRSDVTFIGAHVLGCAEDLTWVGRMLDTYPNAFADVAARIAELGRVPRAARALLVRHPDRFVFGTDASPVAAATYKIHRRFFETADECFDYAAEPVPPQGRWTIDGLDLPSDVLAALYGENAPAADPGLVAVSAAPEIRPFAAEDLDAVIAGIAVGGPARTGAGSTDSERGDVTWLVAWVDATPVGLRRPHAGGGGRSGEMRVAGPPVGRLPLVEEPTAGGGSAVR